MGISSDGTSTISIRASAYDDAQAAPTRGPQHRLGAHCAHSGIKLIALDLDGTVLTSNKKLTRRTIDVVKRARAQGVDVILVTARPPRSTLPVHTHLELDTPLICYNGAVTFDVKHNRAVHHDPLPVKLCKQLVRAARRIDRRVIVNAEIVDRWYSDLGVSNGEVGMVTETYTRFEPDHVGPIESFMHKPLTKLMFFGQPDELSKVRGGIRSKFDKQVTVSLNDAQLLSISNRHVNKAVALHRYATSRGIAREHVMAIGDAPNDRHMLRWAGLGVAMENAWPRVIDIADAVTDCNDSNGVATAIEKHVLS
jgi:5-amino-6-(5-phospho-D-ribitylamino)uracil phosphatase